MASTRATPSRAPKRAGGRKRSTPPPRGAWLAGLHLPAHLWFDVAAVLAFLLLLLLLLAALPVLPSRLAAVPVRVLHSTEGSLLGGAAFLAPALLIAALVEVVRYYRFEGPPVRWFRYLGGAVLLGAWVSFADVVATGHGGLAGVELRRIVGDALGAFGWLVWLGAVLIGLIWALHLSLEEFWVAVKRVAVAGHWSVRASSRAAVPAVRAVQRRLTRTRPLPVGAPEIVPLPAAPPLPVIRTLARPRPPEVRPPRASSPKQEPLPIPRTTGVAWRLPETSMLKYGTYIEASHDAMRQRADMIVRTLADFGIAARVQEIRPGPTVTQFGVRPDPGVKVARIVGAQNDLALALEAHSIRVEAPVPGKPYVGIEVPNPTAMAVTPRELLESQEFQRYRARGARLPIVLGSDVAGEPVFGDLTRMPHLLIAGATGAGKSVCINSLITCLLFQNSPDELQLIMVDPKQVELTGYNGIPHLKVPVIVDPDKVVGALDWCIKEMERRYALFARGSFRDISRFNETAHAKQEAALPYLVVIIDELADLMMTAPEQIEQQICRLAQKARATGIHLVVATQRPSVDVITGLIKANFPSRIAFAVSSGVDSKTILDSPGAERLLGRGDMLYTPADALRPMRAQGAWVSEEELEAVVDFWRKQREAVGERWQSSGEQQELLASWTPPPEVDPESRMLDDAVEVLQAVAEVARAQGKDPQVTLSLLQRRLRIGQNRASLLMDELFDQGYVGMAHGPTRARTVLLSHGAPEDIDTESAMEAGAEAS